MKVLIGVGFALVTILVFFAFGVAAAAIVAPLATLFASVAIRYASPGGSSFGGHPGIEEEEGHALFELDLDRKSSSQSVDRGVAGPHKPSD